MSTDKYSNDHTIEIVKGDTVTVGVETTNPNNLCVTGDLVVKGTISSDLGDQEIDGNLDVSGDLQVDGDLNVNDDIEADDIHASGNMSADNFEYNNTKNLWVHSQLASLEAEMSVTTLNVTIGPTLISGGSNYPRHPVITVGSGINDDWEVLYGMEPYLRDGARLKQVWIVAENVLGANAGEIEVELFSQSTFLGGTGTWTNRGDDKQTFSAGLGLQVQTHTFNIDSTHDIDIPLNLYRLRIRQVPGIGGPINLLIHQIYYVLEVDDVETGLNIH
jgi:hypothetical protein